MTAVAVRSRVKIRGQSSQRVGTKPAISELPFDVRADLFAQMQAERLAAEHRDLFDLPFTRTRDPRVGIRVLCDSTVTSPVPSSTLYIRYGTSGTPQELVTTPLMLTEWF